MNNYIYLFLSGILIGIGMILPGISGSVIAIILGIYEEILSLINKKYCIIYKLKRALPILMGIIIGILIFGKILLFFYVKYKKYMMYVFTGIILGGIPILYSQIKKNNGRLYYFEFFLSFFLSIVLTIIPRYLKINIYNNYNSLIMFLIGIIYIFGKIIPGISSSFFLMLFGVYDFFLRIITNPLLINITIIYKLLPFIFGILLGLIFLMKIMNYVFDKYYYRTYSAIIGFVLGSVFPFVQIIKFNINGLISLIIIIISFELTYKLSKK